MENLPPPILIDILNNLPPPILIDILSRLDSTDLARCKVASKAVNSISSEVRVIKLQCSLDRYIKSRSPLTQSSITPFKNIIRSLISDLKIIEDVSIGVEKRLQSSRSDGGNYKKDLYLTDVKFVKKWLPVIGKKLKSLSISDLWVQACLHRSRVLSVISAHCHDLETLAIRNTPLSVDGLKPMPKLTSLTLEYIYVDDENLNKINECFPHLKVLNLRWIGGLREPKIHLQQLKSCHLWMCFDLHSVTIIAPNLHTLKLKCEKPRVIIIEAPLLTKFHLSVEEASEDFRVKDFLGLETLHLETLNFCNLLEKFLFGKTVKTLTLESIKWEEQRQETLFSFGLLFNVFPNVETLTLTPGYWFMENVNEEIEMKSLKELKVYLVVHHIEMALQFIFAALKKCPNLLDVNVLIDRHAALIMSNVSARCMCYCPTVRWRFGLWNERVRE